MTTKCWFYLIRSHIVKLSSKHFHWYTFWPLIITYQFQALLLLLLLTVDFIYQYPSTFIDKPANCTLSLINLQAPPLLYLLTADYYLSIYCYACWPGDYCSPICRYPADVELLFMNLQALSLPYLVIIDYHLSISKHLHRYILRSSSTVPVIDGDCWLLFNHLQAPPLLYLLTVDYYLSISKHVHCFTWW